MFDVLTKLKDLIKARKTCIDNNVFSLHYRFSVYLLMAFAFIISSNKYFGDPIDCTAVDDNQARIVDNFCWFNSYIIVPKEDGAPYEPNRYPALADFKTLSDIKKDPKYKPYYLRSYQWIEFLLFIQAVFFFLPRYLWRYCWEQERIKCLTEHCSKSILKQDDDKAKNADVVKYFFKNNHDHFEYACKYVLCEVLNFANVLAQFLIVQKCLGMNAGDLFHDLVTSESNHEWKSLIARVFPNLARCDVITAATGGAGVLSQLCVLPINIFATKIYIMLWFYLLFLTVLSGLSLIFRGLTIGLSPLRTFLLKRQGKNIADNHLSAVKTLSYGDWFVLCLVGKNMNPFDFSGLVKDYNEALMYRRPSFSLDTDKLIASQADFGMMHRSDVDKKS